MKTKALVTSVDVTNSFRRLSLKFRGIGENGCSNYFMTMSIPLGGFVMGRFSDRFIEDVVKEARKFLDRTSNGQHELDAASLREQLDAWSF